MSLSIEYENIEQANMRLQGTVVKYDGEPVYVTNVGQVGLNDPKPNIYRVYAAKLPYNGREAIEEQRKFISSKKFDLAPFPMGFMNKDGVTYYCHRLPRKQQRQGLSNGTFSALEAGTAGVGAGLAFKGDNKLRLEFVIEMQEFVDCIKGKYPSFEIATKQIEDGARGVGFSRCFALVRDEELPELVYLYHKREKVGFIMDGHLNLTKAGKCLRESLREVGVKC